ncbi:MAG: hypothetical protein ABI358_10720 [Ginsengibacter sp.]
MKIYYFFLLILISSSLNAQNFNGQWKGGFNETSYGFSGLEGNDIDYVLEIQTSGSNVSGYSYTYFNEGKKRYYTICKLTGTVDKSTGEIVVTEIERVKFNTPPGFRNCFQTHKLHYVKDSGDVETLRGTWMPAPNQDGDCGYGTTTLSRRIVKSMHLALKPVEKKSGTLHAPKKSIVSKPKSTSPKIVHNNPAKPIQQLPAPVIKKDEVLKDMPLIPELKKPSIQNENLAGFERRRKDIIKTIPIFQQTFKVDFYDNGEIDGDSITVFYNGRILLSHKMLTTKAISLTLSLDDNVKENVITMYADNLGTIPPNTALMIVTDGDKRYEVRISSDTEKSGSVVFVHGEK